MKSSGGSVCGLLSGWKRICGDGFIRKTFWRARRASPPREVFPPRADVPDRGLDRRRHALPQPLGNRLGLRRKGASHGHTAHEPGSWGARFRCWIFQAPACGLEDETAVRRLFEENPRHARLYSGIPRRCGAGEGACWKRSTMRSWWRRPHRSQHLKAPVIPIGPVRLSRKSEPSISQDMGL